VVFKWALLLHWIPLYGLTSYGNYVCTKLSLYTAVSSSRTKTQKQSPTGLKNGEVRGFYTVLA